MGKKEIKEKISEMVDFHLSELGYDVINSYYNCFEVYNDNPDPSDLFTVLETVRNLIIEEYNLILNFEQMLPCEIFDEDEETIIGMSFALDFDIEGGEALVNEETFEVCYAYA